METSVARRVPARVLTRGSSKAFVWRQTSKTTATDEEREAAKNGVAIDLWWRSED
jgi:hypothetical protein